MTTIAWIVRERQSGKDHGPYLTYRKTLDAHLEHHNRLARDFSEGRGPLSGVDIIEVTAMPSLDNAARAHEEAKSALDAFEASEHHRIALKTSPSAMAPRDLDALRTKWGHTLHVLLKVREGVRFYGADGRTYGEAALS